MGKIYCITGQSRILRENVFEALLDWSEKRREISFSMMNPDGTYNLYLNDYLINADWEEYKQMTEQFDEDILVPVYLGSDEGDSELWEFGVFKTYNVSYDDYGFDQGVREILSSEFACYKDDYSFREKEEVIDEALVEDSPEDILPEASKKQSIINHRDKIISIGKAVVIFLKKRKKIELAGMAAALCIVVGITITLSMLANRPDPFYSCGNFNIFSGMGDSTYIFSSNGDTYTFDGYSNCSISKTIDGENAVLTTDYNELYYLTERDARKITDDIYISYITNRGEYIYYITKIENNYVLNRYETKNGETVNLDYFTLPDEDGVCEITASPNGKMFALNFNSLNFSEQCFYNFDGEKTFLEDVELIYAVTDKGVVFCNDKNGKFVIIEKTVKKNEIGTGIDILREGVYGVYFNSDYSEVLYRVSNPITGISECYIYTTKDKTETLLPVQNLANIDKTLYWRIKETTSNVNHWNQAYIYDIDTFSDMYFMSLDDKICRLNKDYTLKFICQDYISVSGNGEFIISGNDYIVEAVDTNGNYSVLLDKNKDSNINYIGVTDNKSVYYIDGKYLCYKKGNRVKKIYEISGDSLSDGSLYYYLRNAIDSKNDIIYFIEDSKLYYSRSGNNPVEIKTDNYSLNGVKEIISDASGVYYIEYLYGTDQEYTFTTYKIYKITDSYELKFIYEYKMEGSNYE